MINAQRAPSVTISPVSSTQSRHIQPYLHLLDTMELDISSYFHSSSTQPMALFSFMAKYFCTFLSYFLPMKCVKKIAIILKTLPRDWKAFNAAVHILFSSFYFKLFNCTVTNEFEKLVRKHPNKVCFHFEEQIWTFKQVDEYTNKVAQVFHNAGYKKGDTVAIFMTNRPEYACIWLGLGKLGIISALINTNLKLKPLTYSLGIGACKAVIFSNDLCSAIHDIRPSLESTIRLFQLGGVPKEGISSLDNALKVLKPEFSNVNVKINFNDHLLYIYTSGTTGFPKAAIMPHSRFLLFSSFARYLLDLKRDDIVYNPLPMYHTAGGILGVMTAITLGATAVIKRKFSASSYIPDCIKYKCTVGQYIGEICRYILSVPSKPSDKEHRLRIMVGNGLRSSIWAQFVSRFNIPNVMEIYGSTEGNLLIANVDNTIGAVGSLSKAFPMFNKYIGSIIKVDPDTMEPIRNEKGFCIECSVDEPGMFVGIIPWKGSMKEFYGYVDKGESNKKFIYDVFKKGDRAFVSGDLMVQDEMGYIYFKDRTGDTFRWKGENVSTSECESLISSTIGLTDCVVYGVQVHDLEGRAGMLAVLDPDCKLDMDKLARALDLTLPKYQHPIFIRLLSEIEMTGTFKFKKLNLQKEGFDPNIIKDPIFFRKGSTYVRMTRELHDQILNGSISL
ncbi:long-chain fatty acid transport protein 4-like [Cimex lectularius]|uniref:Very long-chain fatty acid transport protein n=1 Tax=Cimex lectularius TaxID=79782 RepID=A0A8I6S087_CIMLE|nr:long-chain fatty acid transport protein 4-like [Cimex lectularius]